jgi:FkbM family methyltransferase
MKSLLKRIIPANSLPYQLARSVYQFRFWHPREFSNDILNDYAAYKRNVRFVQIGSNNGISDDPINRLITEYNWQGILVEPIKYLFEELRKNYNNFRSRLKFENSAIANVNGRLKFYRLEKSNLPGLPYWYDQIGSFNKDVVLKHRSSIPHFDELFIEDSIESITFTDLLKKHAMEKIDFIQIDTEGYDYEILKTIPFSELNIEFIMFENKHLSEADYKSAISLLKQNGYEVGTKYKDTVGISRQVFDKIMPRQHKGVLAYFF